MPLPRSLFGEKAGISAPLREGRRRVPASLLLNERSCGPGLCSHPGPASPGPQRLRALLPFLLFLFLLAAAALSGMDAIEELALQPCTSSLYLRPFRLTYRQVSERRRERIPASGSPAQRLPPRPSAPSLRRSRQLTKGAGGRGEGQAGGGSLRCPAPLPAPRPPSCRRRSAREVAWASACSQAGFFSVLFYIFICGFPKESQNQRCWKRPLGII